MSWSPEAEARIARRIEALVRSTSPLRDVAIALDALPLYADLDGAICLRPDGRFAATSWDTGSVTQVERSRQIMALVVGSRAYPDLADVLGPQLPSRPPHAPGCSDCEGAGRIADAAYCEACLGLGWRGALTTDSDEQA